MRLVLASEWITETFENGSEPTLDEVRKAVESGEIPGRLNFGRVFVDAERYALQSPVTEEHEMTGMNLLT